MCVGSIVFFNKIFLKENGVRETPAKVGKIISKISHHILRQTLSSMLILDFPKLIVSKGYEARVNQDKTPNTRGFKDNVDSITSINNKTGRE